MGRFALFKKKERWTATWLGNLLKLTILVLLIILFSKTIHPFLSEVNPVDTKTMVLEGFVPDYVVEQAKEIFIKEKYEMMLITGKKRNKGDHLDIYENDGEYTAATLEELGFDMTKVLVIPVNYTITKDRTYESGKAVKQYFDQFQNVSSFNLVSIGCHSRRSRYLFEKAFNYDTSVGIIAIKNQGYDPERWWQSSNGVRQILQETIAWTYARFFFYP
jgi:hypothetical protein